MKKIASVAVMLSAIFTSAILYAQQSSPAPTSTSSSTFPPVAWSSASSADKIVISNGGALPIVIMITVDRVTGSEGIDVANCGNTAHVNPGSTAVCTTNDPDNPVTFNATNAKGASGNYQIKQQ